MSSMDDRPSIEGGQRSVKGSTTEWVYISMYGTKKRFIFSLYGFGRGSVLLSVMIMSQGRTDNALA